MFSSHSLYRSIWGAELSVQCLPYINISIIIRSTGDLLLHPNRKSQNPNFRLWKKMGVAYSTHAVHIRHQKFLKVLYTRNIGKYGLFQISNSYGAVNRHIFPGGFRYHCIGSSSFSCGRCCFCTSYSYIGNYETFLRRENFLFKRFCSANLSPTATRGNNSIHNPKHSHLYR